MKSKCVASRASLLEEELQEKQQDAQQKVEALKELIDGEKRRLDEFKMHLDTEKDAYMEILRRVYESQICPHPEACSKREKANFKENMGDFTVCVKNPNAPDGGEQQELPEDEKPLIMFWSHENEDDPKSGTKDQMLVQLEKQLTDDMVLQMQLEAKGTPRKVCPCKIKDDDGISSPFPPAPHSHTTYYKAELTICNVKDNNAVRVDSKMKRFDKVRNMYASEGFCRSECN